MAMKRSKKERGGDAKGCYPRKAAFEGLPLTRSCRQIAGTLPLSKRDTHGEITDLTTDVDVEESDGGVSGSPL